MSRKITVYLPVWAEYAIEVDIPDEDFEAENFEDAIDAASDKLPAGLCHQCSTGNTGVGFFEHSEVHLELGEQPEAKYAADESGRVVWGDIDAKVSW